MFIFNRHCAKKLLGISVSIQPTKMSKTSNLQKKLKDRKLSNQVFKDIRVMTIYVVSSLKMNLN